MVLFCFVLLSVTFADCISADCHSTQSHNATLQCLLLNVIVISVVAPLPYTETDLQFSFEDDIFLQFLKKRWKKQKRKKKRFTFLALKWFSNIVKEIGSKL